jgi:hypothetical protein
MPIPQFTLRLVEAVQRPCVLDDPRVIRDFTRVCEATGILDPDAGLIQAPQRDGAEHG